MLDFERARQIIDHELESYRFDNSPAELYEPVRYILAHGGKRIRPALTLMACSVFSDSIQKAINPALAFEVFHNFTLLHDDIMDKSSFRRGKETVHEKWNSNVAILSGDVMSILSYQILSESDDRYLKELLQLFNQTALQVCEGQQWDMNFEASEKVPVVEYLRMIELKTAVLIAACLKAGAISGGADLLEADLMYEFGRNLGIAFQIRDDYLDVFGDSKVLGKQIGNDILANKKTFLLIKALELSQGKIHQELSLLIAKKDTDPEAKVKRITEIFSALELDRISDSLASEHYEKALQYLKRIHTPEERKSNLSDFAKNLMKREK